MHGSNACMAHGLRELRDRVCKGRLCVHRNGNTCKTRKYVVLRGFGPNHNMGVYNNNVTNIECSMTQRYFLCEDAGEYRPALDVRCKSFKSRELDCFRRVVLDHMPRLPVISRKQVVAMYHGPKKRVYEQARLSLVDLPLHDGDSELASFSKFEKVDVSKPPRNISPRSPRYNLELARRLKHAEHHFFTSINKCFGALTRATVIKGFNADDSASILHDKWLQFGDPVAVGLDAKKFDMHVSIRALQYEHSFYTELFPRDRVLRRLLTAQLVNRGVAYAGDGRVEFSIPGTRSSGDLNTSLGNCILMCAMVWAYAKGLGIRVELANNGDDCVVFMERSDVAAFREQLSRRFRKWGFAMTVEDTVDEFEQIEFCQTRPVMLSTGWRMVRNLTAVLEKDPMCLVPIANPQALRKWMYAVGECGGALCSGVPILESFYSAFRRLGLQCRTEFIEQVFKGRSQLQLGSGCKVATVTPESRCSFYFSFGVEPEVQRAFERYYDNLTLDLDIAATIDRDRLVCNPGDNILDFVQR